MTDQVRQVTLRFRQRERAGRQGHAGDGIFPDGRGGFGMFDDPVFLQQFLYRRLVLFLNVGNDQVLVAGKPEVSLTCLSNFQQGGFQGQLLVIQDPAMLDKVRIIPESFVVLLPAIVVFPVRKGIGPGRFQGKARSFSQFRFIPVYTVFVNRIFQPGQLAVAAIPVVPLYGDDLVNGFHQQLVIRGYKTKDAGQPWVCFRVSVGRPQSAADGDVESLQFPLFDDGDEAQVIGEYVYIVVGRNGDADLEFAGQVTVLVERILFVFFIGEFFFVQPYLKESPGLGQQQLTDAGSIRMYLGMQL